VSVATSGQRMLLWSQLGVLNKSVRHRRCTGLLIGSKSSVLTGERRYLTIMFCDLVGSTAISAQLDAEEWRDLLGAYLDAASAAVAEMGGHVAKKLGDGLMCVFGYPLAHENDAERAARAALSVQRALAELNRKNAGTAKPELVARIGLESGPAVSTRAARFMAMSPTSPRGCRRWPNRARC
jgi:class 3 adenylate cyclase